MTLFKEYKKKSVSDPRKTFEAIVYDKLNEFDELMIKNSLENENINKDKIWKGICSELNWEFIPTI